MPASANASASANMHAGKCFALPIVKSDKVLAIESAQICMPASANASVSANMHAGKCLALHPQALRPARLKRTQRLYSILFKVFCIAVCF